MYKAEVYEVDKSGMGTDKYVLVKKTEHFPGYKLTVIGNESYSTDVSGQETEYMYDSEGRLQAEAGSYYSWIYLRKEDAGGYTIIRKKYGSIEEKLKKRC